MSETGKSSAVKVRGISKSQWLELRVYAAKLGWSMSRVVLELAIGGLREIERGGDPLGRLKRR